MLLPQEVEKQVHIQFTHSLTRFDIMIEDREKPDDCQSHKYFICRGLPNATCGYRQVITLHHHLNHLFLSKIRFLPASIPCAILSIHLY